MSQEKTGGAGSQEKSSGQTEFLKSLQKRSSSVELMARLVQGTFNREKPFNPQTPLADEEAEKDVKKAIRIPAQAITEKVTSFRQKAWEAWDKYHEENNTEWVIKEGETKKWKDMSPEEKQGVRLQAYADRQVEEVWDKFSGKGDGTQDSFRKGLESLGLDWAKAKADNADNIWQRDAFKNFVKDGLYQKYFSLNKNTVYEILQSLIEKSTDRGFLVDSELVKNIQSLQPFLTALFGEKKAFDALSAVADLHLVISKYPDFFNVLKDAYDEKTMALGKGKTLKEAEEGVLDYLKGASCEKKPTLPSPSEEKKPVVLPGSGVPPPPENQDKTTGAGKTEAVKKDLGTEKEQVGEITKFDSGMLEWTRSDGEKVIIQTSDELFADSIAAHFGGPNAAYTGYKHTVSSLLRSGINDVLIGIDEKEGFEGTSEKICLAVWRDYRDNMAKNPLYQDLGKKLPAEFEVLYQNRRLMFSPDKIEFREGGRELDSNEITEEMHQTARITFGRELLKVWSATSPTEKRGKAGAEAKTEGKEDIGEMTKFDPEGLEWTRPDGEKVRIRQCRQSKGDAREGIEASFGSSRILKNRFWDPDRILNGIDDSDKIALSILDKVLKDKENPMCKDLAEKVTGSRLYAPYKDRPLIVESINLGWFEDAGKVQGGHYALRIKQGEKDEIVDDEMMQAIKVAVGRKIFSIWAAPRGSRTGISQEVLRSAITFQFRDNSSRGLREALIEGGFLLADLSPEEKEQAFRDTLPEERIEKLSDPESQLKETLGPHEEAPIVGICIRPDELLRFIKETIKLPNGLRISKNTGVVTAGVHPAAKRPIINIEGGLDKTIIGKGVRVANFSIDLGTEEGKLIQGTSIDFTRAAGLWRNKERKLGGLLDNNTTNLDTEIKGRMDSLLKQNGIDRFVSRIDIGDDGMLVFDFSKTAYA